MHLLDVNVWLALAFDSHVHHPPSAEWFASAELDSCCFCRMTQQGFLRLATTPRVMSSQTLSLQDAWRLYDELFDDPRVVFAEEPGGIEPTWRAFTQHSTFSPKVWNDAYLAAFAMQGDLELVTFDKAFSQYSGLRCRVLA